MKNLIVCCDGTWNDQQNMDDGVPAPTNIKKIFDASIDGALNPDETNGIEYQLTRYQAGVGTEGLLDKMIGGLLGKGLSEDIRDCFQWLSDKYTAGDQIFIFGFSRGAFAARSLAGLIGEYGLVDFENSIGPSKAELVEEIYTKGYRNSKPLRDQIHFHNDSNSVCFLGVFDTVGALGIPNDKEILELFDNSEAHQFHDTTLSNRVKKARHAVAIDERRGSFSPTLWSNENAHQNVKQVWFSGVHSDIGGGYNETGLSDCTLDWMLREAQEAGLQCNEAITKQISPDPKGVLHDSHTGVMKILRTAPRSIPKLENGNQHISGSVLQRLNEPPIHQANYLKRRFFENGKVEVDVYAVHRWYWTGIYLESGKTYKASAIGEWLDASIVCSPQGVKGDKFQLGEIAHKIGDFLGSLETIWKKYTENERADFFMTKREENADWFELIGAIANGQNPDIDGTHDTLEKIRILKEDTFEVTSSGYLYCFANDAWGFYHNNRGYVTLTIEEMN